MKNSRASFLFLCLFLYSSISFSKTMVVSDIDDTIKKANSMGGIGGVYHFLRKKPYEEARDLFNELKDHENSKGEETAYYYVSAAPSYTFNADKWIKEQRFPAGPTFLKTKENGGDTYDYKHRTIKALIEKELENDPELKVIFFGDNSQHDAKVYYDLKQEMGLDADIYIRDVSTEATFFSMDLPIVRLPGVIYFFSEMELVTHPDFIFMSPKLKGLITKSYQNKSLVPAYTLDTLSDRLKNICKKDSQSLSDEDKENCKIEGKNKALIYWNDYYSRL